MKALIFSKRNLKEIIRDPVSLAFGVGLPVVMMIIFYYLYLYLYQNPTHCNYQEHRRIAGFFLKRLLQ